jgi:hypothetical protein
VPQDGFVAAANGKLYVMGGIDTAGVFNNPRSTQVQEYDPTTDTWSMKAPMPLPTGDVTPVEINGRIYVAGGDSSGGFGVVPYNALQVFDAAANSWSTAAPMPTARNSPAAANVNGRLHVLGGNTASGCGITCASNAHEVYDPATNVWTADTSLPSVSEWPGAAGQTNVLYVVGGTLPNGSGGRTDSTSILALKPTYIATIEPPIDANGSSVFNAKRGVVPVKFTLAADGLATCQLPGATISVTRTAGGTLGVVNESDYLLPSDSGSNFRIDTCHYVYNVTSGSLGTGTYVVAINIDGAAVGTGTFSLK